MRPLLLLIAILAALPLAAHATPHHATAAQAAEAEARSFLTPCRQLVTAPDALDLCHLNQRNFIEQYVYAKAGDYSAQGSTALSFDTHRGPDDIKDGSLSWLGMPQSLVQACAWRMVQMVSPKAWPTAAEVAQDICGDLAPLGVDAARGIAALLIRALRTHPARMPSLDWEPAFPTD